MLSAFLIHIVAYVGSRGQNPPQDCQVSHLCDRRNCFNPDHLRAESPQVNNSRKGCAGPIFCSIHGHLVVDLCTHQPRCIRAARADVFCCLAIRESDSQWGSRTNSAATDRSAASRDTVTTQRGARQSQSLLEWMSRASESFDGARELEEAVAEGLL
ncbi:HNH endonuclease [Cystobacter fuscus]|uniref:HNH endonuclease n=1 Tax=Cystobacter fuscus TaxID=43 RepID=UPI0005BB9ADD